MESKEDWSMSSENCGNEYWLKDFSISCQAYLMGFWRIIETEFESAIQDGCGEVESGYFIILNTPLWRFMAMVLADSLKFKDGKEFWKAMKPRNYHRKMYKFLESQELKDALAAGCKEESFVYGFTRVDGDGKEI